MIIVKTGGGSRDSPGIQSCTAPVVFEWFSKIFGGFKGGVISEGILRLVPSKVF